MQFSQGRSLGSRLKRGGSTLQIGDIQLIREFDCVLYGCSLGEDGNEMAVVTVVVTDEANMKESCGKISSNKNDY